MPTRERVLAFIDRVQSGDYVGAIADFYTEDASMQEHANPPRVGRDALMENEKRMMAAMNEIRVRPITEFAIEGDFVFLHCIYDLVRPDGSVRALNEIAVQEWRGDRIFRERFYYDPATIS